jgi:hypothetical protein
VAHGELKRYGCITSYTLPVQVDEAGVSIGMLEVTAHHEQHIIALHLAGPGRCLQPTTHGAVSSKDSNNSLLTQPVVPVQG